MERRRLASRLQDRPDVEKERGMIQELGQTRSEMSVRDLVRKLASPRFSIRAEALNALVNVRSTKSVKEALIREVQEQPYTTAYLAADIIGRKEISEGIRDRSGTTWSRPSSCTCRGPLRIRCMTVWRPQCGQAALS